MGIYGTTIRKKDFLKMSQGNGDNENNNKIIRVAPPNMPLEPNERSSSVVQISIGGVIAIVVTIAIAAVSATWILGEKLGDLKSQVALLKTDIDNNIKVDISEIQGDISGIQDDISGINIYLYNDGGVKDQLGDINQLLNIPVVSIPNDEAHSEMKRTVGQVSLPEYASPAPVTSSSPIGLYQDGEPCYAKDVVNDPILLTYTEGDKEIYFYGMYNENYHWDGYCVTNVYLKSDGTLFGICESNFDDGNRIDYKSFYRSDVDKNKWLYSNKKKINSNNVGVNISYTLEYTDEKNFTETTMRINDILYVDTFIENTNPRMLTYYSGNTSDGLYNDDKGKAYEVEYFEDGTVKTLYLGKFSNGTFNDDTGNAWDIVYVEQYGFYVYNTGVFENGSAVNKAKDPISIEEINKIISGYKFDCKLDWKLE